MDPYSLIGITSGPYQLLWTAHDSRLLWLGSNEGPSPLVIVTDASSWVISHFKLPWWIPITCGARLWTMGDYHSLAWTISNYYTLIWITSDYYDLWLGIDSILDLLWLTTSNLYLVWWSSNNSSAQCTSAMMSNNCEAGWDKWPSSSRRRRGPTRGGPHIGNPKPSWE